MLALAISLLFVLAAFAALAVIRRSLLEGTARARLILAQLAEIDRCGPATRLLPRVQPLPAFRPGFAVA
jgi:hypothetical protein